jgi:hypothetical protein
MEKLEEEELLKKKKELENEEEDEDISDFDDLYKRFNSLKKME